ncbi:phosphonate ABC transporter ATP-binding protein [Alkalispirochaeta sphaeroplastigenens]|uniref:Phosphonate ABC transporter ATP-binding protein n=1 Tax=Alkalispirochaeta sphaeroplastigenens TaxID=1187066 RepID=A0A2S4K145_9SPIO|nr:phosphonate ABC transporter ATP-binding protein [Alkalispirochaeta sphaeroplastigenens]POR05487.1 phosphonate ABC transporter ATP-binding protein [Alkalispirochaeta sphaeroplastigenens]
MLKITNLEKSYTKGAPVLKGLNLTTDERRLTAIIGSSGAGKSTLLRCINRLVKADSGSIELDGTDILSLSGRALQDSRRQIGMIFQAYNLVDRLTVMENVLSGRLGYTGFFRGVFRKFPQEDVDRAYALLKRVGLSQYVNKRCDALSGGERQRVGCARALMQNPRILLADEPTASLDPKTSERIMELIAGITEELDLPVLINLHNVPQATTYADRILGLRHGVMIFDGNPDELTEDWLEQIYAGHEDDLKKQMKVGAAEHDDE